MSIAELRQRANRDPQSLSKKDWDDIWFDITGKRDSKAEPEPEPEPETKNEKKEVKEWW